MPYLGLIVLVLWVGCLVDVICAEDYRGAASAECRRRGRLCDPLVDLLIVIRTLGMYV